MSVWSEYETRITVHGNTQRERLLNRERTLLDRKLRQTISYHQAEIDGVDRMVVITDTDNLNTKTIYSLPGEDILCGAMVHWMDNYWIVTETDANKEIRTKGTMLQCNYLLRWVTDDGRIRESWSIVNDGTKLRSNILCLAYWKRYVKTISRIAGKPLELRELQREDEICLGVNAGKSCRLGNQQPSLTRTGSTTRLKAVVGTSVPKRDDLSRKAIWKRYGLLCCESSRCA